MTQLRDAIEKQIRDIPRLATLPPFAIELTQILEQQDVSVNRIKRLIKTDPERVAFDLKREMKSARVLSDDTVKIKDEFKGDD